MRRRGAGLTAPALQAVALLSLILLRELIPVTAARLEAESRPSFAARLTLAAPLAAVALATTRALPTVPHTPFILAAALLPSEPTTRLPSFHKQERQRPATSLVLPCSPRSLSLTQSPKPNAILNPPRNFAARVRQVRDPGSRTSTPSVPPARTGPERGGDGRWARRSVFGGSLRRRARLTATRQRGLRGQGAASQDGEDRGQWARREGE